MPVEILADTVVKHSDPSCFAEGRKLVAYGAHAGQLFRVPKVLACSADALTMERVDGYAPLLTTYLDSGRSQSEAGAAFRAAGSALAGLHACSSVSESWVQQLIDPAALDQPTTGLVLLHGDYGFSNVLFRSGTAPVPLIIDPGPNGITTSTATTTGRPLDDIALMMSCIIGRVPLSRLAGLRRLPRGRLAREFLAGYEAIRVLDATYDACVTAGRDVLEKYLVGRRHLPVPVARHLVGALARGLEAP